MGENSRDGIECRRSVVKESKDIKRVWLTHVGAIEPWHDGRTDTDKRELEVAHHRGRTGCTANRTGRSPKWAKPAVKWRRLDRLLETTFVALHDEGIHQRHVSSDALSVKKTLPPPQHRVARLCSP